MKLVSETQLFAVTLFVIIYIYGNLYTETIGVCSLPFEGVFHFGSHKYSVMDNDLCKCSCLDILYTNVFDFVLCGLP